MRHEEVETPAVKRAFVVGHPIAHSRSPVIHGHWLAEHGIEGSYERIDVAPADFPAFFAGLREGRHAGGNVTIPHKEAAFRLADDLSETARRIGAVNTLVVSEDGRVRGDNTDAAGFIANLRESKGLAPDAPLSGQAVVLGAGGTARAVAVALLDAGIGTVLVANRNLERGRELAAIDPARIRPIGWDGIGALLPETTYLVNTTPLGMTGQAPLDLDIAPLPGEAVVADVVYAPLETALLARARALGLRTADGLGMLLHQAVPGFEAWFGVRPAVTDALRRAVLATLRS
ncbi:shikimate dehydrogenase [Methylobacterium sp. sgz302541]|uniref:shikimate dehydrogenase n=1 Tax=unclassified Methylobacterium TaxID=2615210 RepID=UPI003D32C484